jgi:hypothetical protein
MKVGKEKKPLPGMRSAQFCGKSRKTNHPDVKRTWFGGLTAGGDVFPVTFQEK